MEVINNAPQIGKFYLVLLIEGGQHQNQFVGELKGITANGLAQINSMSKTSEQIKAISVDKYDWYEITPARAIQMRNQLSET